MPDSTVKTQEAREEINLEEEKQGNVLSLLPFAPLQKCLLFPKASSEALNPFIRRVSTEPSPSFLHLPSFSVLLALAFDFDGFRLFISVRLLLMWPDGVRGESRTLLSSFFISQWGICPPVYSDQICFAVRLHPGGDRI